MSSWKRHWTKWAPIDLLLDNYCFVFHYPQSPCFSLIYLIFFRFFGFFFSLAIFIFFDNHSLFHCAAAHNIYYLSYLPLFTKWTSLPCADMRVPVHFPRYVLMSWCMFRSLCFVIDRISFIFIGRYSDAPATLTDLLINNISTAPNSTPTWPFLTHCLPPPSNYLHLLPRYLHLLPWLLLRPSSQMDMHTVPNGKQRRHSTVDWIRSNDK